MLPHAPLCFLAQVCPQRIERCCSSGEKLSSSNTKKPGEEGGREGGRERRKERGRRGTESKNTWKTM
jgi:hypothetical protein